MRGPGKLGLARKALTVSRGRLAAEARVDKALVSRWLRGVSAPRGHNLEAVTALMADAVAEATAAAALRPQSAEIQGLLQTLQRSGTPAKAPTPGPAAADAPESEPVAAVASVRAVVPADLCGRFGRSIVVVATDLTPRCACWADAAMPAAVAISWRQR